MKIEQTKLKDVVILTPKVFGDERGFFMESWSIKAMENHGLNYNFVQDNHSSSTKKYTLRGIHFQKGIHSQAKLVRCTKGSVLDVAVDLRPESPQYKNWVAVELSAENKKQLLVPRGFGHGFITLTDEVEFLYKADNPYMPQEECSILWNDPELNIDWTIKDSNLITLSEKDGKAPLLKDIDTCYKGVFI